MQAIHTYIQQISRLYASKKATEHSYRPALQDLVLALVGKDFKLTNEPKRQACGAPDYILEKGEIPVGFIEAKDIGVNLDKLNPRELEQQKRYLASLDNLIYTDYLEFRFYQKGQLVSTVKLGEVAGDKIVLVPDAVTPFVNHIKNFAEYKTQTIKSAKQLAEMMAKKALLIKDVFTNILNNDKNTSLHAQYAEFKRVLLHEVTKEEFADIYAETLAYGLFTARLHDTTKDTFSRGEAYGLIPRSNPFLRQLFTYVGTDLDDRAVWIVDALCEIFLATDVEKLMTSFNRGTGRHDPFLHFYETFLGEYNPSKKKSRGVWYTPEAVVGFIVRAVDEVLQTHFGLPQGLADTSKTTIQVQKHSVTGRSMVKEDKEVHRVQVLDVATGTGTFLAEVIAQIHDKYKAQQGMWSSYVERDLIPRVHGFELLMASYAMCHMKLELLLQETGYKPKGANAPRLNVYLTNSLQKPDKDKNYLPLLDWFSSESNQASDLKRETPVMVAIGNPPYSGVSSNMGDDLIVDIEDYKYVDGVHFGERKHWLHDDYVKFIRLGEHFVAKNGEGVMGYITNHSWLDNPTFRGMRWHLLKTFDDIYILDLHGNAKKKEICPDGSPDKNVFDIQQGVAILIGVRRKHEGKKKTLATVHHAELWGTRDSKYAFLNEKTLSTVAWQKVEYQEPFYFFMPKNMEGDAAYQKGFGVDELFTLRNIGIQTSRDFLAIDETFDALSEKIKKFIDPLKADTTIREEFFGGKSVGKYEKGDSRGWKIHSVRQKLLKNNHAELIKNIAYRPFDNRKIYYSLDMVDWPRPSVMRHFEHENYALLLPRQIAGNNFYHVFVTKLMAEMCLISNKTKEANQVFPLYLYDGGLLKTKTPNLDGMIWEKIKRKVGKAAEDPQAVFDYVYAVLHAPSYRSTYAEFLKSDFPRIPYPTGAKQFEAMVALGAELRQLHLLEHPACNKLLTTYPMDGSHMVDKVSYADGKVWINAEQYFEAVPAVAWEFYIGGYQPAQKWLKDRRGRELTLEDITHYQRIIATLAATADVMILVDKAYKG
ncbi:MAG: DNA methyltransferase [Alphaproteobacteria bacterium]|nr:MAG: DNA methyltransferase [Alphaproteobacteria bacterium]